MAAISLLQFYELNLFLNYLEPTNDEF
jgi:hypothetical protein